METRYAELGEHPESSDFKQLSPIMRELTLVANEYRTISEQIDEAAAFARTDKLDVYDQLADIGLWAYKQWQAFEHICEDIYSRTTETPENET